MKNELQTLAETYLTLEMKAESSKISLILERISGENLKFYNKKMLKII